VRSGACWSGDSDIVRVDQVAHGFHAGDFVGWANVYDQPGYWGPPVSTAVAPPYAPPGLCTDESTGEICALVYYAGGPHHWIGWKRDGASYSSTADTASRWIALDCMPANSDLPWGVISRIGCVSFVESADKFHVMVGNRHAWSHMPADPKWAGWCASHSSAEPASAKGQAADVCTSDFPWRWNKDAADTYRRIICPGLSPWGNASLEWLHNHHRGNASAHTRWKFAAQSSPPCVLGYPPADAIPINGALFCVDPDTSALYVVWNTAVGGVRSTLVDAGTVYLEAARPYWVDTNISWLWLYTTVVFGGAWRAPPMGSEGWVKRWFSYAEKYYT
jgi:hypothetical protein